MGEISKSIIQQLYDGLGDSKLRPLVRKLENELGGEKAELSQRILGTARAEGEEIPGREGLYISVDALARIILEAGGSL